MDSIPDSPPDVARILAVCSGNLCRSPYLERRLIHELSQRWDSPDVAVSSAGTQAVAGSDMAPLARTMLWRHQPDSEPFEARALTVDMVREASLVITATRQHRTLVARMDPRSMKKTHALLDLAHLAEHVELSPELSRGNGARPDASGTPDGSGGSGWSGGAGGSGVRDGAGTAPTAAQRLEHIVPQLARLRGTIPTLPENRSAVVDPIGRSEAVFEQMREQIETALAPILRLLGPQ